MSIDILVENYSCRNLCSGVYNDIVERSLDSCQISAQKKQPVMDAIEIWLRDGEKCGFRSLAQKSVVRDRRESVNAHVRKVEQDIARDQDRAAEEWLSWLVTVDAHRACGQVKPALSDSHPGYNTNGKYGTISRCNKTKPEIVFLLHAFGGSVQVPRCLLAYRCRQDEDFLAGSRVSLLPITLSRAKK